MLQTISRASPRQLLLLLLSVAQAQSVFVRVNQAGYVSGASSSATPAEGQCAFGAADQQVPATCRK